MTDECTGLTMTVTLPRGMSLAQEAKVVASLRDLAAATGIVVMMTDRVQIDKDALATLVKCSAGTLDDHRPAMSQDRVDELEAAITQGKSAILGQVTPTPSGVPGKQ